MLFWGFSRGTIESFVTQTELRAFRVCCSSASNRIIGAKDHASIQINIAEVKSLDQVICMELHQCVSNRACSPSYGDDQCWLFVIKLIKVIQSIPRCCFDILAL